MPTKITRYKDRKSSLYRRFSLNFNGMNEYLTIPNSTVFEFGTGDFAISFWFNARQIDKTQNLICKYPSNSNGSWFIRLEGGQIKVYNNNGVSDVILRHTGVGSININTWYHVVFVKSGTTLAGSSIWVNGVNTSSPETGTNWSTFTNTSDLNIGRFIRDNNSFFDGEMRDVVFFNTTLTSTQITRLHNKGTGSPPNVTGLNPILWIPMESRMQYAESSYLPDLSVNRLNATMINFGNKVRASNNDTSPLNSFLSINPNLPVLPTYNRYRSIITNGSTNFLDAASTSIFDFGTNPFSVSFWIRPNSGMSGALNTIVSKAGIISGSNIGGWVVNYDVNNQTLRFVIYTRNLSTVTELIGDFFSAPVNNWHHIVITWTGGLTTAGMKMYINSLPINRTSSSTPFTSAGGVNTPNNLRVGRNYTNTSGFSGRIDNLMVYNIELSQSNVNTLFNNGLGSDVPGDLSANCLMYHNFEAYTGTDTNPVFDDQTSNNIDLTGQNYTTGNIYTGLHTLYDYATLSDNSAFNFGTGDFSISIWIHPNFINGTLQRILSKIQGNDPNYIGWEVQISTSNRIVLRTSDGLIANTKERQSAVISAARTWYHVVVVKNGHDVANWRIYINNVEGSSTLSSPNTSSTNIDNSGVVHIGGNVVLTTDSNYFSGFISNITIYKRVLSAEEVTELYNHRVVSLTSMAARYDTINTTGYTLDGTSIPSITLSNNSSILTRSSHIKSHPKFKLEDSSTNGNYVKTDGVNDTIFIPWSESLNMGTGDFSISVWFNPSLLIGSARAIFSSYIIDPYFYGFLLRIDPNGQTRFQCGDGSRNATKLITNPVIQINTWYHLVITKTGNNPSDWIFYLNGSTPNTVSNFGTLTGGGNVSKSKRGFDIGSNQNGTREYFNGFIANLQIYRRVLTSNEVTLLYNNGVMREPILSNLSTLVAYYNFSDAPDSSTLLDLSGRGNNGTYTNFGSTTNYSTSDKAKISLNQDLTNIPIPDIPERWCASLDGINDFIAVTHSASLAFIGDTSAYSISMWARQDSNQSSTRTLIGKRSGVAAGIALHMEHTDNPNRIAFEGYNGTNSFFLTATTDTVLGRWYHIVLVRSAEVYRLYIDGILNATYSGGLVSTNLSGTANLTFGDWGGARYFHGRMSNIQIFNKELSLHEVRQLGSFVLPWGYTPASASSALQGKWMLNDIVGTNVRDFSSNNNVGVVTNAGTTTNLNGGFWVKDGPDPRYR